MTKRLTRKRQDKIAKDIGETAATLEKVLAQAPTPEGFASRLFHVDRPDGRRFVGTEADEARKNGWVDSPAKLTR